MWLTWIHAYYMPVFAVESIYIPSIIAEHKCKKDSNVKCVSAMIQNDTKRTFGQSEIQNVPSGETLKILPVPGGGGDKQLYNSFTEGKARERVKTNRERERERERERAAGCACCVCQRRSGAGAGDQERRAAIRQVTWLSEQEREELVASDN